MINYKEMAKKYYLSYYQYDQIEMLLDVKRLVKRDLLRKKPKREVLNRWYFLYIVAK